MKEVVDSEWEETLPPEGPGKRLKLLREAQELGRSRAASLLHLDESKLEALEKDDYAKLPASVFVRGYLKNYARLLNVPADQILAQYDRIKPAEERRPNLQISSIKHEMGSGHLLVRLMTWGIIIGLITLVVVWWKGQLLWPLSSKATDDSVDITAEFDISDRTGLASLPGHYDNQPTEENAIDNLVLPPLTSSDDNLDLMQQETVAGLSDSEGKKRLTPPSNGDAYEKQTSESPALMPRDERVTQPSSIAASAGDILIELIGDSWVNIQDASGSFRIQSVLKQGTQSVLTGHPPYKIVLGKASAVRLIVKGKVFDLAPYTQGDVARLSLNPDM